MIIGSFGRVLLAKNKKSGEYFAMKRLKKADIIKLRQVDHVISENTILADIDHPFLVSYFFRFNGLFAGGPQRFFIRCKIFVFLDGVYCRWRVVHLLEN